MPKDRYLILTMSMSLALDMAMLALAVVAAAIRSLHDTSGTTGMATMTMMAISGARIRHGTARLIHEHNKEDGQCS